MAAVHNLYIDQGADFSVEIGIFDDFNTPWDLSGYSAEAHMKKSHYSSTYHEFSATPGANGIIALSMTSTVTGAIAEGRYLYDIVITSAAGQKTRVIEGIATINPGVTT
jgi:hypothetical protein|tara:strand:- start:155 stop:481 length:327 start_codon:yes stop_codon:yes gene_type:complete